MINNSFKYHIISILRLNKFAKKIQTYSFSITDSIPFWFHKTVNNRYRLKVTLLMLTILIIITACIKKVENYDIYNLNGNDITILGHRGMGELYKHPGNTFEGITPVFGIGAAGAEIDVQITKDSVLVLFHDKDMKLTTTCEGAIYENEWVDIGACEYHCLVQNVYIITVDNLFSRTHNLNNLYFSFDCKLADNVDDKDVYMATFLCAIKDICDKYSMSDNIYIEGNEDFLTKAQDLGLTNKLFVTGTGNMDASIKIAQKIGAFGIGTDNLISSAEDVKNAHDAGFWVMMWGAKTRKQNIEIIEKCADIVQTDKPMHMLKVFSRFNYDYQIP